MKFISRHSMDKTVHDYEIKGKARINKSKSRKQSTLFVDLKNIWHAKTIDQQNQYQAIRSSGIFDQQRKLTFVKFNYRFLQRKNMNYSNVFNNVIGNKNTQFQSNKMNLIPNKGTMNVSDLWSERQLKQTLGSLPFPQDRVKVLKLYSENKFNIPNLKKTRITTQ